jgi:hypothetical protein
MNTWKIIIGSIFLFLIGVQFFMGGLFPRRSSLPNKTSYEDSPLYKELEIEKPKKVIMLLIDALREDFVQIDEASLKKFDKYKGKKISLF